MRGVGVAGDCAASASTGPALPARLLHPSRPLPSLSQLHGRRRPWPARPAGVARRRPGQPVLQWGGSRRRRRGCGSAFGSRAAAAGGGASVGGGGRCSSRAPSAAKPHPLACLAVLLPVSGWQWMQARRELRVNGASNVAPPAVRRSSIGPPLSQRTPQPTRVLSASDGPLRRPPRGQAARGGAGGRGPARQAAAHRCGAPGSGQGGAARSQEAVGARAGRTG